MGNECEHGESGDCVLCNWHSEGYKKITQELAALKSLVMEMGVQLENVKQTIASMPSQYSKYWYDTHENIYCLLSRPEVRAILSPPREPDHQIDKRGE